MDTPDRRIPLAQLARIDKPCTLAWDSMRGDARRRHCADCNKDVHNLSAMTEAQARRLLRSTPGELCLRYVTDGVGRPITRDRSWRTLAGRVAAAALLALPFLSGCRRASMGGVCPTVSPAEQTTADVQETPPPAKRAILMDIDAPSSPFDRPAEFIGSRASFPF